MESRPACALAKSTASHSCFQVQNSSFLPEPLRRARSWSRLALDPGTGLSLHKKLRVLLTIIYSYGNNCFGSLPRDWLIKCSELIVGLRIRNSAVLLFISLKTTVVTLTNHLLNSLRYSNERWATMWSTLGLNLENSFRLLQGMKNPVYNYYIEW